MNCPDCLVNGPDDLDFCRECGAPLRDPPILTQDDGLSDSPESQSIGPSEVEEVDVAEQSATEMDSTPMEVSVSCQHVKGPVKENDQDYCLTVEIDYPLHGFRIVLMVGADGIGGAAGGERWAQATAHMFVGAIRTRLPAFDSQEKFLDRNSFGESLVNQANTFFFPTINWVTSCIYQFGVSEMGEKKNFGCTLVAAAMVCDLQTGAVTMWRYSVGDSSIFMLFDDTIDKINEDHSRDGQLTRYVGQGINANGSFEKQSFQVQPGLMGRIMLLLCSDGLTNMLSPDQIMEVCFKTGITPAKAARALIKAALEVEIPYGETINPNPDVPVTTGDDNIFVAITQFKSKK